MVSLVSSFGKSFNWFVYIYSKLHSVQLLGEKVVPFLTKSEWSQCVCVCVETSARQRVINI